MLHFLVPSDPFDPKEPDEIFRDQVAALREQNFGVTLFSLEELQSGGIKIRGPIPPGATVVYRGWMVSPSDYGKIVSLIESRGAIPLTSLDTYLSCHYLPNWYPLVKEFTAETRIFPADAEFNAELKALGWQKFFIKDYVKSLKTSVGSVISRPEEMSGVLSEMEKFRGTIEGGVCVRRFEKLIPDSERRYFVIGGVPHSSLNGVPELVRLLAPRISSPFFAIDVAQREDGALRIVEIGDGQVSDLVGWGADSFARLWQTQV